MSFQYEPALWVALVEAVLVLLVAFGVPISNDQKAAVIGVVSAVLAVVGGFVTRSQVMPMARVEEHVTQALSATLVPPPVAGAAPAKPLDTL